MIQEDKDLLLRDLCCRLPYGVIVEDRNGTHTLTTGNTEFTALFGDSGWHNIKPYLRPMSSMTEEEKHELLKFGVVNLDKDNNAIDVCCVGFENHAKVQDYLNSIHVDYRGLINKGLAIEVTHIKNKSMEEFREFRGYLHGNLLYTFPLHWVDNIKIKDGVMIVSYYDEMQYNAETGEEPLVEIRVDEIDVK